jgi:hypothetical protein
MMAEEVKFRKGDKVEVTLTGTVMNTPYGAVQVNFGIGMNAKCFEPHEVTLVNRHYDNGYYKDSDGSVWYRGYGNWKFVGNPGVYAVRTAPAEEGLKRLVPVD